MANTRKRQVSSHPRAKKIRKTEAPYSLKAEDSEKSSMAKKTKVHDSPEKSNDVESAKTVNGSDDSKKESIGAAASQLPNKQKEPVEGEKLNKAHSAEAQEQKETREEPKVEHVSPGKQSISKDLQDSQASSVARLIAAKDLVPGEPETSADPPGIAPPGDSRSLRRIHGNVEEFVLIYRDEVNVITRQGVVGKEGKWKCVQYPTLGAAAHAYAQECSHLTGQGYADLSG